MIRSGNVCMSNNNSLLIALSVNCIQPLCLCIVLCMLIYDTIEMGNDQPQYTWHRMIPMDVYQ